MAEVTARGLAEDATSSPMVVVGQLVALGAALLPAVGVAVRVVAFWFEPRFTIPLVDLAVAMPIGSLAALGLQAMFLPLSMIALFNGLLWQRRREMAKALANPGTAQFVLPRWIALTVMIGVMVVAGLFAPWSTALTMVPGLLATLLFARSIQDHRLRFSRAWLPLVLLAFASALLAGLTLVGLPSGFVVVTPGSGLPSGSYSVVGVNGEFTYLLPCQTAGRLASVENSRIASISYYKRETVSQPSVISLIFLGEPSHAGVSFSCPKSQQDSAAWGTFRWPLIFSQ